MRNRVLLGGGAVVWALLWAGAFLATKIALKTLPALEIVSARALLSGLILAIMFHREVSHLSRDQFKKLTILGLLNNGAYLTLMALALPHIPSGLAAIVSSSTPLFVLGLNSALGGVRMGARKLTGIVIAFTGIGLSAADRLGISGLLSGSMLLALCGVICLAVATFLTPRFVKDIGTYAATGVQGVIAGIPLAIACLFDSSTAVPHGRETALLVYLVGGASLVGMSLWLFLINKLGSNTASVAHFLPPIFGLLLGAGFAGESLTWTEVASVVPVCLGVWVALHSSPKESKGSEGVADA